MRDYLLPNKNTNKSISTSKSSSFHVNHFPSLVELPQYRFPPQVSHFECRDHKKFAWPAFNANHVKPSHSTQSSSDWAPSNNPGARLLKHSGNPLIKGEAPKNSPLEATIRAVLKCKHSRDRCRARGSEQLSHFFHICGRSWHTTTISVWAANTPNHAQPYFNLEKRLLCLLDLLTDVELKQPNESSRHSYLCKC